MALVNAETVTGFQRLPALRQLGLMIGLAASVALGVAVVLWSQTPAYTLLYGNLSSADAGNVIDALQKSGIEFKVDQATGAVMVPNRKLHTARMELAKDGLPEGNAIGFELLEKEQGYGTSQFIETVRYQRALEGELSRTISALRNIESARVHLAIPKRTVFLRDSSKPTASIMTKLYSGRTLDEAQVAAIVHLVSSSIPHLEPAGITVVDQNGNLLSNGTSSEGMAATSSQFAYNRKLEKSFTDRIKELLEPMVGKGKVRATVAADLDFTITERTQETYNPDLPALRSEQISEDLSNSNSSNADASGSSNAGAGGVPGALSNQPPESGQLQGNAQGDESSSESESTRGNSHKRSVRNYELDKTVSHTKLASGTVRRLSIAVVIDNKQTVDDKGKTTSSPWDATELASFTTLIKEAVGFSEQRGDTVNVINSSFLPPPEIEPIPEPSLLEKPWLWDVLKQVAGALGLVLLVFGVLKPILNNLAKQGAMAAPGMIPAAVNADGSPQMSDDQLQLSGAAQQQQGQLQAPAQSYESSLQNAQSVVSEDPKRVAQVVKNWVAEDG